MAGDSFDILTAEQRARVKIDAQLKACGWMVQDYQHAAVRESQGVAVREMPTTAGRADYVLFGIPPRSWRHALRGKGERCQRHDGVTTGSSGPVRFGLFSRPASRSPRWERATLGDVCNVVGGATPKTKIAANWGDGVSWITPDDLSHHDGMYIDRGRRSLTREGYESCSAQLMPAGSVLFTSRAPIGYVAISSGPVCTNQGFKSFVPRSGLSSEYLYWYLRFATPEIRALGSGTTFKEISKAVAASIWLPVPPNVEQTRIVAAIDEHFSRLDAAGAALDAVRAKIGAFRRSVLAEAFAGRLVPQDPDDEPAAALLARIAGGCPPNTGHRTDSRRRPPRAPSALAG